VSVVEVLLQLGGVASRGTLVRLTSRNDFDRAVRVGDVVRIATGTYALPHADEGLQAAHALAGALSHTSAALFWGWEITTVPARPHVTVPVKRKVARERRRKVQLHRTDLSGDDVCDFVTSKEVTLGQCLRTEPWPSALAVADSALRHGFSPDTLRRLAEEARGPGSPQMRRAARHASPKAANPFESVLRAIALDVAGLNVQPQVILDLADRIRPDLVDADLRIVLEADSFEWHGSRVALRRDAQRYNRMVIGGWTVLRFAWEDVMHDQSYVRSVLQEVVALATGRREGCGCRCHAA
jgi:very-short-patch-repair endonuclease